jgi:hypothetical protein
MGHALGLGESYNKDAVMYFRSRPLRDDIYAIQKLYVANRWATVSPEYADMLVRYKIMQLQSRTQNYYQSS